MARTSVAHLQRPLLDVAGDPLRLFQVGTNWTRTSWQKDPDTGLWLPGVLLEPARTNLALRSEEMDQTPPWVPANASVINTSSATLPDGAASANDVLHEDGTAAVQHSIGHTVFGPLVNGTTYVASVFAKPINRDWLKININNAGTPVSAYFNCSSGVVGTLANCEAGIVTGYLDGFVRPWIRWTHNESASRSLMFYLAEADNDDTFDGLNQDSMFLWGFQGETGAYPSSYIKTGSGSATRTADGKVVYVNDYLTDEVTVVFPVWIPEHAPASDQGVIHLQNSAGSSYLSIGVKASTGVLRLQMKPVGGTNTVLDHTTNICDGKLHWIGASARCQEYMVAWVDGVGVGAVPLDQFKGAECDEAWLVGNNTVGPWTGGIHIWPKFMTRMPRPVQPQLLTP